MFTISRNEKLTPEILSVMFSRFFSQAEKKMQLWKDYYDGKQMILQKTYNDTTKPCSKSVTNFCKNIVDIYTGYIAAPNCISYQSDKDITQIQEVLKYNDVSTEDADLLKNALIYGVGSELMYIDSDKNVRFTLADSLSSFPVYSDDLEQDLLYFVRWTKKINWELDSQEYIVSVYDNNHITNYLMVGQGGSLTFLSRQRHFFNQCPANVLILQDERSIFDCIMSLQDSYNEVLTSQSDEISGLADSYLAITGEFDSEEFAKALPDMRKNRAIAIPSDCKIEWLTKDLSGTQSNAFTDRIREDIYRIACCPDFSSESFNSGVTSGIAIRYKLTGCETRAATIEARMKKALQRRIELICGYVALLLGEEIFRDIRINFERNTPEDINSIAQAANILKDVVSNETLLTLLPFIDDPKAEAEKVAKQREENESLYQKAFLSGEVTTDEEEE